MSVRLQWLHDFFMRGWTTLRIEPLFPVAFMCSQLCFPRIHNFLNPACFPSHCQETYNSGHLITPSSWVCGHFEERCSYLGLCVFSGSVRVGLDAVSDFLALSLFLLFINKFIVYVCLAELGRHIWCWGLNPIESQERALPWACPPAPCYLLIFKIKI